MPCPVLATVARSIRLPLATVAALWLVSCGGAGTINRAPEGRIDAPAANVSIAAGASVTFQGSCSDPEGDTVTHAWNFGLGAPASTLQSPGAVVFANAGTYSVSYTCTDAAGLADPTPETRVVTVTAVSANRAPNGTITSPAADASITAGGSVTFAADCADPDGDPVTHAWGFGGGAAASNVQNPGAVTFPTAGTYAVSYTCTDSKNLADPTPATRTITVTPFVPGQNRAPVATIGAPAANVTVPPGGSVNFQGSCVDPDGDSVTHAWSFGGAASPSTAQNPGNVVFATLGTYAVTYSCTDSHGLAAAAAATRTITVSSTVRSLSGVVTFDKVPPKANGGLNYAGSVQKPVRGADVSLVDSATGNTVLATAVTGSDGSYTLGWPSSATSSVKVVVFARTNSPVVAVQDNTAGKAVYSLLSTTVDATTTSTLNLHATAVFNATSNTYTSRSAAPFAVLDSVWQAVQAFKAARPAVVFPEVHLNWSANNQPVGAQGTETPDQALAAGHIVTSFWNGTELYLLGQVNVDTDEFDDHVIVHEWGHYFESKLGRSDSPGGSHSSGDIKDPRLAFGEGWGNGLSAIIWSPATTYTDSSGTGQAGGFFFDMENNASDDPNPGWYSEGSVQSIFYDLFDGANEANDTVALGLGPIYDAMTGAEKTTPALTTLFSFITALKAVSPGSAAAIDALTRYRGVVGVNIADAYGTGETNAGGAGGHPENLPLYKPITVGTPVTAALYGGSFNELGQNRYYRWTGTAGSHTVQIATTPAANDVDVEVFKSGVSVASAAGSTGSETTNSFTGVAGAEYVIVVTGFATSNSSTVVTVH